MENKNLLRNYASNLLIWRGVLLVLFGLFIMIWPISTLLAVLIFVAIYALAAGIIEVISGIVHISKGWSSLAEIIIGLFGMLLGILILKYPAASALVYIIFLGIWFLIRGFYEVVSPQSKIADSRGYAIFIGILTVVLGAMLIANPVINGVILYWALGLYGVIAGPFLIAFGLSLKSE